MSSRRNQFSDWKRSRAARRKAGSRRATYLLTASLALLVLAMVVLFSYIAPDSRGAEVSLDGLRARAAANQVQSVVLLDEDARIQGVSTSNRPFWVGYPKSDAATADLLDDLVRNGARVEIDGQGGKSLARLLVTTTFPLLVLANLFAIVIVGGRGSSSGIGEVITFGSLGQKKLRRGQAHPVSFKDVGAVDEAVVELKEVVDYLTNPERYQALGAAPPKGVLLFGPPGCGKTLLAKAVAGEAGVPFVSVAGAEFVESLVGVGAARVRDLFARVRAVAPAIVFIDELDAAGRRRGGAEGGSEERDQTLNQMLVEMDGFDVSAGIVVMAATNRPDILDPALLRPGRFDRHITVPLPDPEGRREILKLHSRSKPVDKSLDFESLARRTPGFSGADLANVVNEATLLAIREGRTHVDPDDFEEAVRRVVGGPQRRGQVLLEEERSRLATYEAARVVVAAAYDRKADLHRVSILDQGRALRPQSSGADGDAALVSAEGLRQRLVIAVSGAIAEEQVFGEHSTHAETDLEHATALARDLAGKFGMSPKLGKARLMAPGADLYLSGGSNVGSISEERHRELDAEVRRMVDEASTEAARVLDANRSVLSALIERLEVDEHLEGAGLEAALKGVKASSSGRSRLNGRSGVNGKKSSATQRRSTRTPSQ
jgi:cell division protease FtsH